MKIQSAKLIYFSPTRTTRKVLEGIARGSSGGSNRTAGFDKAKKIS